MEIDNNNHNNNNNNHDNGNDSSKSVDSIIESFVLFPSSPDPPEPIYRYYQAQHNNYSYYYPHQQYSNIFGYQSPYSQMSSSVAGSNPVSYPTPTAQFSLTNAAYPPTQPHVSSYTSKAKPTYPSIKQFAFVPYTGDQVQCLQQPTYSDLKSQVSPPTNANYTQYNQGTNTNYQTTPSISAPFTDNFNNNTSLYPTSPDTTTSTSTPYYYPPTTSFSQASYPPSFSQSREIDFNQNQNTNYPTFPLLQPTPNPPSPYLSQVYPNTNAANANTTQPYYNPIAPHNSSYTLNPSYTPNPSTFSNTATPDYSQSSSVFSPSFPSYVTDSRSPSFNDNPSTIQANSRSINQINYDNDVDNNNNNNNSYNHNQANRTLSSQIPNLNTSSHINSFSTTPPRPYENTFASMITDLSKLIESEKKNPDNKKGDESNNSNIDNNSNNNNNNNSDKKESINKDTTTPGGFEDDDDGKCLVCFDLTANTAITPCGHLALCFPCAGAVVKKSNKCPICNSQIGSIVQIFKVV